MSSILRRIGRDKRGATAIEYGLIASLIVIAIIAAVHGFADATIGMWDHVSTTMSEALKKV